LTREPGDLPSHGITYRAGCLGEGRDILDWAGIGDRQFSPLLHLGVEGHQERRE